MPNINNINQDLRVWARRLELKDVSPITQEKVEEIFKGMDMESRMVPMSLAAMMALKDNDMDKSTRRLAGITIGITAKFMAYYGYEFAAAAAMVKISEENRQLLAPHFRQMKDICQRMVEARKREKGNPGLATLIIGQTREGAGNMDWDS
jgi:hypothetical protein